MRRGEIRWYQFKRPDKKRPVLILTRNSIIDSLNEITIAPITSRIRNIPSEVFLSAEMGLPKDCVANFDHMQTVSKTKIGSYIALLPHSKFKEVRRAIRFALDL